MFTANLFAAKRVYVYGPLSGLWRGFITLFRFRCLLSMVLLLPFAAVAEEQEDKPALSIELNAVDTIENACRLTFLLKNHLGQDIERLTAETVLFSTEGQVTLLTLFDFGKIPFDRLRVRQFQVPVSSCDAIGQVLVNGLSSCEIEGAASEICEDGLTLSSRAAIALEG